jgi:hypothetical protein
MTGHHPHSLSAFSPQRSMLGILSCLDGYMNIALEQTEEHVNGAVTNRYGDAFIRGNNGTFIVNFLTTLLVISDSTSVQCCTFQQ